MTKMLHILRHNSTLPLPKSVDQVSQNDLHTQLASQSTLDANLSGALGDFGGEHRDVKDNAGYYTCMICVSDLPLTYDPGRFFILYPGVFVALTIVAMKHFSGFRV